MVSGQSESLPGGAGCSSYRHGGLSRSHRGLGFQLRYGVLLGSAGKKKNRIISAVKDSDRGAISRLGANGRSGAEIAANLCLLGAKWGPTGAIGFYIH